MPRKILGLLTETLVDSASDAILAIDKEGKIHIYNPAAAQVFGLPLASVMGRKVWDVIPLTPFSRSLIAMIKESNPTFTERTYSFPGDRLFLGQLLPVRNEEGRLAGAVAVLKDMTHLSRIEQHVSDFVA
ncbi:MAG: PAS domain-containing protein, partial [Candidatus Xenobia bacterium]